MAIINETSELGLFLGQLTNVTGSLWLSLLLILVGFVVFGVAFRIPVQIMGMILLPFLLVGVLITTNFLGALAVVIVLIALYLAKQF